MIRPNLFIIGATKCGTTSLHTYLNRHPAVVMSSTKEPGYFLTPDERHPVIQSGGKSEAEQWESYAALFTSTNTGTAGLQPKYLGESSTAYTHLPVRQGVAERLFAFNPDAKLIYIIRDPIDRTISHYWWNVRHEGERRPPHEAIHIGSTYLDVSNYAMQLREYLAIFPAKAIQLITLEELSSQPQESISRLLDWLGLEQVTADELINSRENATPETLAYTRSNLLDRLRYSQLWNRLGPLVPKPIRSLGRRAVEVEVDRSQVDTTELEAWLRPRQQDQTRDLSEILGRSFNQWSRLWLSSNDEALPTT